MEIPTKEPKYSEITHTKPVVPKSNYSSEEKIGFDLSKDTKENEIVIRTGNKHPSSIINEQSKEFTDFMTFEDPNESDIFELSEADKTVKPRSKSRSSSRKRHRRNHSRNSSLKVGKENSNPNISTKTRSRVEEFESLKKKRLPRNLKSRSNSKSTRNSRNGSKKKSKKTSSRVQKGSNLRTNMSSKLKDVKVKKSDPTKRKTVVKDSRLKQKMKSNKEKNSNVKLAKLEKMYQELSELESKV